MARSGRESLYKLRALVNELSDRDEGLKRDASLFEAVFKDFPIPVAIWLADENGLCVSRKVSGSGSRGWSEPPPPPRSDKGENVVSLYQISKLKEAVEDGFVRALQGKQVSMLNSIDETRIWTRLTPRFRDDGTCTGVIGVSWDLTTSYSMFDLLNQISESKCACEDPEMQALKIEAHDAAKSSVISKLLQETEK